MIHFVVGIVGDVCKRNPIFHISFISFLYSNAVNVLPLNINKNNKIYVLCCIFLFCFNIISIRLYMTMELCELSDPNTYLWKNFFKPILKLNCCSGNNMDFFFFHFFLHIFQSDVEYYQGHQIQFPLNLNIAKPFGIVTDKPFN